MRLLNVIQIIHLNLNVAEFHPNLIGLTGNLEEIKKVARAYRVYYMKTEEEGSDYLVDHSIVMYVYHSCGYLYWNLLDSCLMLASQCSKNENISSPISARKMKTFLRYFN